MAGVMGENIISTVVSPDRTNEPLHPCGLTLQGEVLENSFRRVPEGKPYDCNIIYPRHTILHHFHGVTIACRPPLAETPSGGFYEPRGAHSVLHAREHLVGTESAVDMEIKTLDHIIFWFDWSDLLFLFLNKKEEESHDWLKLATEV